MQVNLSRSKTFAFATLLDQKTRTNRMQNENVEIKNNERSTNEILSQYKKFQDIFLKINAHKLFKHDSKNVMIERNQFSCELKNEQMTIAK